MKTAKSIYWSVLIIFVACITYVASASEIYTWTDSNGVVHYSDVPNNQNAKIITVAKSPPVTTGTGVQAISSGTQESSAPPVVATPQEQQQAQIAQKQTKQYCAEAQKNLATLQQTGRRVYTVSPSGQYKYFNDQERQEQIQKMQEAIKLSCTNS
ncbi:MAG: DUF4124 domain-containing protein [Legionellales bacterium]|nr:DUF4124 domain-containing protein [Legionellales bacterium]